MASSSVGTSPVWPPRAGPDEGARRLDGNVAHHELLFEFFEHLFIERATMKNLLCDLLEKPLSMKTPH
jgi:hypothetical protein